MVKNKKFLFLKAERNASNVPSVETFYSQYLRSSITSTGRYMRISDIPPNITITSERSGENYIHRFFQTLIAAPQPVSLLQIL